MKALPRTLKRNGFTYTRLLHKGRNYLYEQTVTEEINYYEVFRAREKQDQVLNGIEYKARHLFPRDKDFGVTAWSIRDYKRALGKYNVLLATTEDE